MRARAALQVAAVAGWWLLVLLSAAAAAAASSGQPPDESSSSTSTVGSAVVSSELGSPNTANHQQQQPMSCYVCSTMDYNDNLNNGCKRMRAHHAPSQPEVGAPLGPADSSGADNATSNQLAAYQASVEQESAGEGAGRARHRKPAETPIRTRQCLADEHYCSIVSVNKLDVKNNTMYTKFWALERNCSKSCNTGCLIIGERIRLRVCSLCCRTPDCNFHNAGAHQLAPSYLLGAALLTPLLLALLGFRWQAHL